MLKKNHQYQYAHLREVFIYKKMKVLNLSKGGGGVKPQIQTFLVLILVVLRKKIGDGLGQLIPIFGSNL